MIDGTPTYVAACFCCQDRPAEPSLSLLCPSAGTVALCNRCSARFQHGSAPRCSGCDSPIHFEAGQWTHSPPSQDEAPFLAPREMAALTRATHISPAALAPLLHMLAQDPARHNVVGVVDCAGSPISSGVVQYCSENGWQAINNVTMGQLPSSCGYIAALVTRQLWPSLSSSSTSWYNMSLVGATSPAVINDGNQMLGRHSPFASDLDAGLVFSLVSNAGLGTFSQDPINPSAESWGGVVGIDTFLLLLSDRISACIGTETSFSAVWIVNTARQSSAGSHWFVVAVSSWLSRFAFFLSPAQQELPQSAAMESLLTAFGSPDSTAAAGPPTAASENETESASVSLNSAAPAGPSQVTPARGSPTEAGSRSPTDIDSIAQASTPRSQNEQPEIPLANPVDGSSTENGSEPLTVAPTLIGPGPYSSPARPDHT